MNGNGKNGTIRMILSALTGLGVLLGVLHTVFIRPIQVQVDDLKVGLRDKTIDRWTKDDANREHDRIEKMLERCCE